MPCGEHQRREHREAVTNLNQPTYKREPTICSARLVDVVQLRGYLTGTIVVTGRSIRLNLAMRSGASGFLHLCFGLIVFDSLGDQAGQFGRQFFVFLQVLGIPRVDHVLLLVDMLNHLLDI